MDYRKTTLRELSKTYCNADGKYEFIYDSENDTVKDASTKRFTSRGMGNMHTIVCFDEMLVCNAVPQAPSVMFKSGKNMIHLFSIKEVGISKYLSNSESLRFTCEEDGKMVRYTILADHVND